MDGGGLNFKNKNINYLIHLPVGMDHREVQVGGKTGKKE